MINIFLVDDHPILLEGIKSMLNGISHLNITGTARDAKETLEKLNDGVAADLILLDLNLPGDGGIELCKQLRKLVPSVKLAFLTSSNDGFIVLKAIQSGANGYILKSVEMDEVVYAINRIMAGQSFISKEANLAMISALQTLPPTAKEKVALTRREKEILQLILDGLTSQEMADKLFLSTHTIDSHRKNMLQKFGAHNTHALIKIVSKMKLLE
ncbi:response regulator transcription factor [Segetibacter sp.]|jgi:two-component system nitrate/nitrite response regulator NarL|uniref:response regulator n=1 Tax=Segetibacter sp. TaxID=2231182 RepID=UPI00263462EE|nr:response regulator transcription factor [Segetibacter sp.]MCW3081970.1 two component transcriptional regulator, LuxR family [Segetibacter sp.]